ncbi:hypothetical protein ACUW99_000872 [Staphylococcus hominis]
MLVSLGPTTIAVCPYAPYVQHTTSPGFGTKLGVFAYIFHVLFGYWSRRAIASAFPYVLNPQYLSNI